MNKVVEVNPVEREVSNPVPAAFEVNPAEVVAAYLKTGLKPERGVTLKGNHACAIGALYKAKFGDDGAHHNIPESAWRNLGHEITSGFLTGFVRTFDLVNRFDELISYWPGNSAWAKSFNAATDNAKAVVNAMNQAGLTLD